MGLLRGAVASNAGPVASGPKPGSGQACRRANPTAAQGPKVWPAGASSSGDLPQRRGRSRLASAVIATEVKASSSSRVKRGVSPRVRSHAIPADASLQRRVTLRVMRQGDREFDIVSGRLDDALGGADGAQEAAGHAGHEGSAGPGDDRQADPQRVARGRAGIIGERVEEEIGEAESGAIGLRLTRGARTTDGEDRARWR